MASSGVPTTATDDTLPATTAPIVNPAAAPPHPASSDPLNLILTAI